MDCSYAVGTWQLALGAWGGGQAAEFSLIIVPHRP